MAPVEEEPPRVEGGVGMRIEISYAKGRKFVAYIPESAPENVMPCLLDDDSVTVTEEEKREESDL